jgi:DNA-binding Lrp family transcriptional regulator
MPIERKIMATRNIYEMLREVRIVNNFELDSHHKSILFCMESRGQRIYPSYKTLAADCGCSPRTAQRKIQELKNHGIIKVETRIKDKRYTSNKYSLNKDVIKVAYELRISQKKEHTAWLEGSD